MQGAIEPSDKAGYKSPIFFKEKQNGSYRLILNLKNFNKNVEYTHFKMKSIDTALNLLEKMTILLK